MNPQTIVESELHAWLDGRLPAARAAEVAAWLAEHPESAARFADYRGQGERLHAQFDALLGEPLPPALQRAAAGPAPASQRWLPAWSLRLAASLLIAVLGAAGGWLGRGYYSPPAGGPALATMARQAAIAHAVYSPDVRRPVEIGAEQEEQLVKWLSKRLGIAVRPPHLGSVGYELVGGRLLPGGSGPVAQFMYQDAGGRRLTLYLSTELVDRRDTAFRFAQEGPVNVFYWVDERCGYALSASIPRGELARVANAVYEQLEPAK